MSDPTETIALTTSIVSNLPPVVKQNLATSLGALISSGFDIGVAWLEGKAKAIRATNEARVGVIESLARKAIVEVPNDPELMTRAKQAFLGRQLRSQINREAIAEQTQRLIESSPPTQDAERAIDPDWIDVFSRIAETKSDEEMRAYFARLLAGEIRKPGSISPATVETLARLTPDLAGLFRDLCDIVSAFSVMGESDRAASCILWDADREPRRKWPRAYWVFLRITQRPH